MRLSAAFGLASLLLSHPTAAQPPPVPSLDVDCEHGRPIDAAGFVAIGGIAQWVTIRGNDCANPVILFLHGGPGSPLSPYSETIYAAWERDFTLVQWDQRGAGRTFGANPPPERLSVALMTRDGIALSEYLRGQLGQPKLVLVGGSWGTVLAVHMARARPDLFHAYLGAGQMVSGRDNPAASYRLVIARARAAGDAAIVTALEALGPPPWTNPRGFGILRRATRAYERRAATPPPEGWWVPSPAYAGEAAEAEREAGDDFSYLQYVGTAGDGMLWTVDLPSLGLGFEIPVFLVNGAEDLVTVPEVARRYFDSIAAPRKEFRLLAATGHDPNAAMVEAQHDILMTRIRPYLR